MPDTPMPATWPALDVEWPNVMERLRTLWRLATTDDQRYHLEVLIGDVQVDHRHKVKWGQR